MKLLSKLIVISILIVCTFFIGSSVGSKNYRSKLNDNLLSSIKGDTTSMIELLETVDTWNNSITNININSNDLLRFNTILDKLAYSTALQNTELTISYNSAISSKFNESLFMISSIIGRGYTYYCEPFGKDNHLSENEISFLKVLKEDFIFIKSTLELKDTTSKNFFIRISPFTNKYSQSNADTLKIKN